MDKLQEQEITERTWRDFVRAAWLPIAIGLGSALAGVLIGRWLQR